MDAFFLLFVILAMGMLTAFGCVAEVSSSRTPPLLVFFGGYLLTTVVGVVAIGRFRSRSCCSLSITAWT